MIGTPQPHSVAPPATIIRPYAAEQPTAFITRMQRMAELLGNYDTTPMTICIRQHDNGQPYTLLLAATSSQQASDGGKQ